MNEQLEARLRYVEGFAADVAHEFKSPLTSIRGAAELLQEGAADDPEARARFLTNIELDVARLDRLVSRLLELSRVEASREHMERVDVADLLASVVQRTSTPAHPVTVQDHPNAEALSIAAREGDLETALVNLVENAQRFSPEGVPVEIEARAAATSIAILVRDRGPGIPPANLPKIFERFFTTDAERNGTGLGLAIVETVIRAHGGSVDVASTLGEGSTFVVTLPLRASSA